MTSALENYINRILYLAPRALARAVARPASAPERIDAGEAGGRDRRAGTLKGFDQTINLILDESHERVFSSSQGVEQVVLGLYIVRGDNV
ncbi:n-alpha-acetyltransferase 38, NatC auxiliary subunit-like protein [Camelus ferus]|nr:n-alpha-acetyltransferase 38, NatC auxiliary subunit-like protein [Camelus ferus]